MTQKEKIIERFKQQPKNFTYKELERLLKGLGFTRRSTGKTSGSRVVFYHSELRYPIMLHKPHPDNLVKGYALKQILDELRTLGLID